MKKQNYDAPESLKVLFNKVCQKLNLNPEIVKKKCRQTNLVYARYIYCYLALQSKYKYELAIIGSVVDLDHATVRHGYKKVKNFLEINDPYFATYWQPFKTFNVQRKTINTSTIKEINSRIQKYISQ